jgi:hypothetical protein
MAGKQKPQNEKKALALYESIGEAEYKDFVIPEEKLMDLDLESFENRFKALTDVLFRKGLIKEVNIITDIKLGVKIIRIYRVFKR